jgi:peptide/nickel transport system substrate-binding protein
MRGTIAAVLLIAALMAAGTAPAQKRGGILTLEHIDNPPSPSIQEEATASVVIPFMPLFNNLVIYDQHVVQNSLGSIVPELATSWKWNDAMTDRTFTLRERVKWHDGRPFTAADVKCTWDDAGLEKGKIGKARQAWFAASRHHDGQARGDVSSETAAALDTGTARRQLVAGHPCHVSSAAMRTKPIGTGPFKFVEFRQGEIIRMGAIPAAGSWACPVRHQYASFFSRSTRILWRSSPAVLRAYYRRRSRWRCSGHPLGRREWA